MLKPLISCLTLCLSLVAVSHAKAEPHAELVDYGLINILDHGQATSNDDALTGKTYYNADTRIVATTNKVALKQGVAFGISWCVYNLEDGVYSYTTNYIYSPFNSKKTRFMAKDSIKFESSNGTACNEDGYELTEPYELLPGYWTIKSKMNNGIEVIKTFVVR